MEDGQGRHESHSFDVLRHPVRVRIIEACTDWGPLSPIEIVNRGLCSDLASVKGKTPKQQLSHIAYHCRKLTEAGLLTLIAEEPKRGATEHFYRANSEAFFSDDEWAALDPKERAEISRVMWQRYMAQVEGAMRAGTFDERSDRWLAWGPVELDERGWKEMMVALAGAFAEIDQIRREAHGRLKDSVDDPIRATYGLFGFQSPAR